MEKADRTHIRTGRDCPAYGASGGMRQLYVTLSAQELSLPMAHRHLQQAMIYHGLRTQDSACAAYLHDEGARADERRFKLFTFGPIQGNYRVKDGRIFFYGEIRFEIRSADPRLLSTLAAAWRPGSRVRLGTKELTVVGCQWGHTPITHTSIRVKTLSPVVAYITREDGKTVFYSPEDEAFLGLLHTNAARKWRGFTGGEQVPAFRCVPVPGRPIKKQVTKFKNTRINAWFGEFELSGETRMLEFLFHTGLGAKNSQGFGMFTICRP